MLRASPTILPHWFETAHFRRITIFSLVLLFLIEGVIAVFFRKNDFFVHQIIGKAALEGNIYGHGTAVMYPAGRVVMDELLVLLPNFLTRAISYLLALLALYSCYRIWERLSDDGTPTTVTNKLAAAVGALVLMIGYVVRDLDECGLQIFLLFFLSAALSNLAANRPVRAGFWLATAATYKVTPILFLPYLVWKRQWQAAVWMVVFIGAWALAPVPLVGIDKTLEAHEKWVTHIRRVSENRQAYPDQLVEPQRTDNLSLAALIARNLETYPPGHPLYVDHPLFWQPGSMSPEAAYWTVRLSLLAFGLILVWRFRRTGVGDIASTGLVNEWAAVCLFSAIFSPIVWKQHLVLGLPALFIIVQRIITARSPSIRHVAFLISLGVFMNLASCFLIRGELSELMHAYKFDTAANLCIAMTVLYLPTSARSSQDTESPPASATQSHAKAA